MSDEGTAKMRIIHMEIERLLNKIALVLPAEYKLTLIARHESMDGANIIMTVDDLDRVIGSVEELQRGANVHESPGAN